MSWGIDLATEHERFLTEEVFRQPVIVYNYPKEIKAFYMKLNEDGKTVAAMDVLVPKVRRLGTRAASALARGSPSTFRCTRPLAPPAGFQLIDVLHVALLLLVQVGELIGGSQREDRYDVLKQRIEATGMDPAPYEAYLDIRKYGSVPHSGFGLGFERLLLFATGLENIREVIPFPRWPGNAAC